MNWRGIRFWLAGLFLLGVMLAPAAAAPRAVGFTLANGLQLVVIPDHRLPIVTHVVYYRAGSADDPPGRSGLAHFLEHLMFKGTKRYPTGQYDLIVNRFGGANNAYTSTDKTYYYEQILKQGLPTIMDLDADRMAGLDFAPAEAEHELGVVLEERRSYDNDPDSVLAQQVSQGLYGGGVYAHPVLGTWDQTKSLTLPAALDFHHRFYGPGLAVVIVAGDVEPDAVRGLAEATYGRVPASLPLPPRVWATAAPMCSEARVEETHPRVTRDRVSLYFLTPGTAAMGVRTAAALQLLAEILQSETASPIWLDLVAQRRVADTLGASHDLRLAAGEFEISVEAARTVTASRLEQALRQSMLQLMRSGIGAAALTEAKRRWLASYVLASDDQLAAATHYGEMLSIGRSLADIEGEPAIIEAVTLPEINAVLKDFLIPRCELTAVLKRAPDLPVSLTLPLPVARPTAGVR